MHGLPIFRFREIEDDAALAAVEQRKERGSHAAEAAGLVTCGRLDLDDLGAELRQNHAAGRTHHHVGHFHDPHARQGQFRSSHVVSRYQPHFIVARRASSEKYKRKFNPADHAIPIAENADLIHGHLPLMPDRWSCWTGRPSLAVNSRETVRVERYLDSFRTSLGSQAPPIGHQDGRSRKPIPQDACPRAFQGRKS